MIHRGPAVLKDARAGTGEMPDTLALVRPAVRSLLLASPAYADLEPPKQRELAEAMVNVCDRAARLLREEMLSEQEVKEQESFIAGETGGLEVNDRRNATGPLAHAQSAGSEYSGVSASRVAGTTRDILNAVSFPRFVTELINGVFKAMVDSNRQQMQGYVELLNNVSASTNGFADSNLGPDRAREWLAERYPESFVFDHDSEEEAWEGEEPEPSTATLRLRPGAQMPSAEALRTDLGLGPNDSVPSGDPEQSLVPLARRALARQRQQMLATMVMLGMQRIVIDSGRIHASMRFHIDTQSAAQNDRGSQLDFRNTINAAGSFGFGPWGASASMTNTIGYVSTDKTQTTEAMNTELDLNSSVELVFKTDYLPLERMAGQGQIDRIKVNTLNPDAEAKLASEERRARIVSTDKRDSDRRASLDKAIGGAPAAPAPPKPGDAGTVQASDKAKADAAAREKEKPKPKPTPVAPPPTGGTPAPTPVVAPARAGAPAGTRTASAFSTEVGEEGQNGAGANRPTEIERTPDVVFIPSPARGVEEMLNLAGVTKNDLVYDLGCGDGRIVIAAAKKYGCLAVGFDIDPARVEESRKNVRNQNVGHLVRIEQRDLFTIDLSEADVVFCYLLPQINVRLIPQFERLKPGARIVSQDFDIEGVVPDRVVQVYLDEYRIFKTFYRWTAPLIRTSKPIHHQWSNAKGLTV